MKILYITASFPYGLGESFLISEVDGLSPLCDEVIVAPLHPRGKRRLDWSPMGNVTSVESSLMSFEVALIFIFFALRSPLKILKAIYCLVKISNLDYKLLKNLSAFPKSVWLASKALDVKADHIHAHWGGVTSTAGMLASIISGKPWSLTCHRWDIYENNLLSAKSRSSKFIRFISSRGLVDSFHFGVDADRAIVIPMGVPIEATLPKTALIRAIPVILCAANLIEVKGHKYLLSALDLLKKKGIAVALILAGEGPLENSLKVMSKELGIEEMVHFVGNLPHAKILDMYRNNEVDIFVLPSIDLGGGLHEGVPVSLMEAMSFGVPSISTNTGSINDLIPVSLNLTVEHKNSRQLAERIEELISNKNYYFASSISMHKIIKANWSSDSSANALYLAMR